jgi:hypothetical protein
VKLIAAPGPAVAAAALAAAYLKLGRPRVLNWGATPEEVGRAMAGDSLIGDASLITTRAITIAASPGDIWPWLVQMGPRPRAGVYTYDWVERRLGIDIENADRILPEFQHLEPGEFFDLNGKGQGLRVREVQPGHSLVLQWEPGRSTCLPQPHTGLRHSLLAWHGPVHGAGLPRHGTQDAPRHQEPG